MTSMLQAVKSACGDKPRKQAGTRKQKPAAETQMGPQKKTAPKPSRVRKPTEEPTKKVMAVYQCRIQDAKRCNRCTREVKGKELCPEHKGHRTTFAQKIFRRA